GAHRDRIVADHEVLDRVLEIGEGAAQGLDHEDHSVAAARQIGRAGGVVDIVAVEELAGDLHAPLVEELGEVALNHGVFGHTWILRFATDTGQYYMPDV